jgi:hypothetical protein
MHQLVSELRRTGMAPVSARLIVTEINQPCHEFFRAAGFTQQGTDWVLDASAAPRKADHVIVVSK